MFQVANNNRPGNDTLTKEVEDLKKKLAAKTQDFGTSPPILYPPCPAVYDRPWKDALKNQAASQAAEYNRLADEYNKSTGAPSKGKKD